jgi:hypothetical protein
MRVVGGWVGAEDMAVATGRWWRALRWVEKQPMWTPL